MATAGLGRSKRLNVYQVTRDYKWPYESISYVKQVGGSDQIAMQSAEDSSMYRMYRRYPDQFVDWGSVPWNVRAKGGAAGVVWTQFEFSVFSSSSRTDMPSLRELIERLEAGGIGACKLPKSIRPGGYHLGTYACPHDRWHEDGEAARKQEKTLFVSKESKIPYINEHTIPPGLDYLDVKIAFFDYRSCLGVPRYKEVLKILDAYCDWYDSHSRLPADSVLS